jgi:hypothetical protein
LKKVNAKSDGEWADILQNLASQVILCALLGVKNIGWLGWRDLTFFFTADIKGCGLGASLLA